MGETNLAEAEKVRNFKTEAEMASLIVEWLKEQKWEVYQEVSPGRYSARADIVAVMSAVVWVIETKLSLSMNLVSQGMSWIKYAHYVSIGVPVCRSGGGYHHKAIAYLLKNLGIGCIAVEPLENFSNYRGEIRDFGGPDIVIPARLNRKASTKRWTDWLCEEHKNYAKAGTSGQYFTTFKGTCKKMELFVKEHPGSTMKEIIDGVNHHWANTQTAKTCTASYIRQGLINIEGRRDGRTTKYYAEAAKAPLTADLKGDRV